MSTILLTGSEGFIGRNLLEHYAFHWPDVQFKTADIRGSAQVPQDLRSYIEWAPRAPIDAIYHLAGMSGVRDNRSNIMDYNMSIAQQLCNWAVRNDVKCIINASSSSVYGDAETMDESYSCTPRSPYGLSKRAVEKYLSEWAESTGSVVVHLRLFNNIGKHQRSNMLPFLVADQLKSKTPLQLFGHRMRGWTYVGDTVRAFHSAFTTFAQAKPGTSYTFNVGTGQSINQLQLINIFEEMSGMPVMYTEASEHPDDVARTQAHTGRFESVFGWSPETAHVHLGVQEVLTQMELPCRNC